MAKTFSLRIVTPEKLIYDGEVEMLVVKATTGEEGFMAGHVWACKLLVPGPVRFKEAGSNEFRTVIIPGGFVDVRDKTLVYADSCEWKEDVNGDKANR